MQEINGYGGKYLIDECGNVYSTNYNNTNTTCILKQRKNKRGRYYVNLSINGKYKTNFIHRLVAETFLGNMSPLEVNHIDGNKENNHVSNLEWVSRTENIIHGVNNNLFPFGDNNVRTKISDADVENIRNVLSLKHTIEEIANIFNCSKTHIRYILNNKRRTKQQFGVE